MWRRAIREEHWWERGRTLRRKLTWRDAPSETVWAGLWQSGSRLCGWDWKARGWVFLSLGVAVRRAGRSCSRLR